MKLSVVAGCVCALIVSMIVVVVLTSPRMTSTAAAAKNWEAPDVQEGAPTQISGAILSPVVDQFEILGFESKSSLVSAEAIPLSPERLAPHKGLCGYEIRVSIKPEMPVGGFKIPLT